MATAAEPRAEQTRAADVRAFPWPFVAWFAVLIIAANFSILHRLAQQWLNDGDMGHGFFVPLVAGFIAWKRRKRLLNIDLQEKGLEQFDRLVRWLRN